jgi:hypothetical protein
MNSRRRESQIRVSGLQQQVWHFPTCLTLSVGIQISDVDTQRAPHERMSDVDGDDDNDDL